MSINISLLKTTNDLQQYFVDKETGEPLSAGVVTLYKDNSRTFLKNWYYQSGAAPNYTYIPLPNPLVLSSVGTIVNITGNDVLPFYYPVSETDNTTPETYYITVDSADGVRQFTRQNFPFDTNTENPNAQIPTLQNLIVNNNFWRNIGSKDLTNVMTTVPTGGLSPSAHDGFSMPDLQFFKNSVGASETVSFLKFPPGSTPLLGKGDITTEYYLNHVCTGIGSETLKYYQMPIVLHIKNLESEDAVFTIDAQSLGSTVSSILQYGIYQFTGTTDSTPTPPAVTGSFNLTAAWEKYEAKFKFPKASSVNVSSVEDDAFYLVIFIPTGKTCNISFVNPSIYLGDTVPTNNYQTYDESDSIINSPRTGDARISINSFQPFGWVPADNGSIGSLTPVSSGATTRANNDTWPLYNLIWYKIPNFFAPIAGGVRGASAYADFTAGKALQLTALLGRVLAGQSSGNFPAYLEGIPFTVTSPTNNIVLSTPLSKLPIAGTPVLVITTLTLPAPLQTNTVYYVTASPTSTTVFSLSETYDLAILGTPIPLTTNGTGVQTIFNALGAYSGNSATSQVPNHTHPFTSDLPPGSSAEGYMGIYGSNQGGQNLQSGGDFFTKFSNVAGTTGANTGGTPTVGLLQPTAFVNFYLKL